METAPGEESCQESEDENWSLIERTTSVGSVATVESFAWVSPRRAPSRSSAASESTASSASDAELNQSIVLCPSGNELVFSCNHSKDHYDLADSPADDVSWSYYLEYNSNRNRKQKYSDSTKYHHLYGSSVRKRLFFGWNRRQSPQHAVTRHNDPIRRYGNHRLLSSVYLTDFDLELQSVPHDPHTTLAVKKHANYSYVESKLRELSSEIQPQRNTSWYSLYSCSSVDVLYTLPATAQLVNSQPESKQQQVDMRRLQREMSSVYVMLSFCVKRPAHELLKDKDGKLSPFVYHYPRSCFNKADRVKKHNQQKQPDKVLNFPILSSYDDPDSVIGHLRCIRVQGGTASAPASAAALKGKELHGRLSTNISAWQQSKAYKHCWVGSLCHQNCWLVPEGARGLAAKPFLQVDLGSDMHVTNVSTKGRYPETSDFPNKHFFDRSGTSHSAYKGLFYKVIDTDFKKDPDHNKESFVRKFSLSYRRDKSKVWVPLGEFEANSNCFDEVVQQLDGVVARYLRFYPSTVDGGFQHLPAMRVGVYGSELDTTAKHSAATEERQFVSYTVTKPTRGNRRYAKKHGAGSGHNHHHYSYGVKNHKRKHAQELRFSIRADREFC